MATGYKHRVIDNLLKRKLKGIGAVLIEGPKLCGKTTMAEQAAKSVVYMTAPQDRKMNEELARVLPNVLLEGKTPRLIDRNLGLTCDFSRGSSRPGFEDASCCKICSAWTESTP